MGFGVSGLAARGGAEQLEDLVAQALQRDMFQARQATEADQFKTATSQRDRDFGLREREFASDEDARAVAAALAGAKFTAERDRTAMQDTARRNMSELTGDPQQLAAFSLASGVDVPAGVRDILTPKAKKFVKLSVPDKSGKGSRAINVPEDDPRLSGEGIPEYRAPTSTGGESCGQKMWLKRDGAEVYDYYKPGDTRAPAASNSVTADQAKKGKDTTEAVFTEIDQLSQKINDQTYGPAAKGAGLIRTGKSMLGLDNTISEYNALVQGFTPMIARAVGHVGVLTQQDVDSVKKLFPETGDNKALRQAKIDRVRRILQLGETKGGSGLGEGTPLALHIKAVEGDGTATSPGAADDVTDEWINGKLVPRKK